MRTWFRQHTFALLDALRHVRKTAYSFSVNVVVIAIALALPFAGLTILENIRPLSEQLAVDPEISIFIKLETSHETATALASTILRHMQHLPEPIKVDFISREKALNILQDKTGLSDVLSTLGNNPLPDSYIVRLSGLRHTVDVAGLNKTIEQLKTIPEVDHVQIDSAWIKKLAALTCATGLI